MRKELSKITPEAAGSSCVTSVSVANFDVLAGQKWGREQKRKWGRGSFLTCVVELNYRGEGRDLGIKCMPLLPALGADTTENVSHFVLFEMAGHQ